MLDRAACDACRAVILAGTTVVISLLGMLLVGLVFLGSGEPGIARTAIILAGAAVFLGWALLF